MPKAISPAFHCCCALTLWPCPPPPCFLCRYMVVDLKSFVPGKDPLPGLLWVAEQIPGAVVAADMTPTLALAAYWPSFNVPAFPQVYNASGYPDFVARLNKYGQHFSRVSSVHAGATHRGLSLLTRV